MANANENVNPTPQIEETPSPQISGQPAGQAYEQAGSSSVTLEAIEELVKREVQSIKDSRIGKLGAKIEDMEGAIKKYDALLDQGMSKDQALSRLQSENELLDIKQKLDLVLSGNLVAPSAGAGDKPWGERQATILKDAGVLPSDARLTEFLKANTFKNHDEYIKALDAKAFEWKQTDAKKPQPSAGAVAQTIPAVPSGDGSYTKEKYAEDMLANRGNKEKLNAIRAQAKADGVDVDNIGLNL